MQCTVTSSPPDPLASNSVHLVPSCLRTAALHGGCKQAGLTRRRRRRPRPGRRWGCSRCRCWWRLRCWHSVSPAGAQHERTSDSRRVTPARMATGRWSTVGALEHLGSAVRGMHKTSEMGHTAIRRGQGRDSGRCWLRRHLVPPLGESLLLLMGSPGGRSSRSLLFLSATPARPPRRTPPPLYIQASVHSAVLYERCITGSGSLATALTREAMTRQRLPAREGGGGRRQLLPLEGGRPRDLDRTAIAR